ncbi:MAG: transporter substrate-binding domain-containing protein [Desulfobacterales bacterium]|nr:transporter substrate-binding domain-containing protein [Desulfobacterales bacterium]
MQRSVCFIVITFSVFICASAFASKPIKVSSTIHPSFSQPDVMPGLGNGVLNDITVQAFKAVDTEIQIEFIPMARIVWSLTESDYDAMLGTINWFTKEKKDHLVEAVDLLTANIVFFYKTERFPDGIAYEQLSDLRKYKVGSIRGSSTIPLLEKAGIPTELVAELDQNFKKLDAGHIDLTVAIDLTGRNIIKRLFPDSANNFSFVKKPVISIMTSMAFPKGQNGPLQLFRKGLDIILANGTFYKIIERYYGKDYRFEDILPQDIYRKMKKK